MGMVVIMVAKVTPMDVMMDLTLTNIHLAAKVTMIRKKRTQTTVMTEVMKTVIMDVQIVKIRGKERVKCKVLTQETVNGSANRLKKRVLLFIKVPTRYSVQT